MKPEMIEGPQAAQNFERAMKNVFQVPKSKILNAEKKQKAERKRKKR